MFFLYNFLLYLLLLVLWPILVLDLLFRKKHRKGILQKSGSLPPSVLEPLEGEPPIWLHGVSVGEVNSLLPMIGALKQKYPESKMVLSASTATGHSFAKEKAKQVDAIIYFPFDLTFICKKVINRINPKLVIISEKEIWPNFLHFLNKKNVPVMWVNGRVSSRSYSRYKIFNKFIKKVLSGVSFFAVDSEISRKRLIDIGARPERVKTTGHTKVDQAFNLISSKKNDLPPTLSQYLRGKKVLVAASTHEGEEEKICKAFQKILSTQPELFLILVPRHPERFDGVGNLLEKMNLEYFRYSQLNGLEYQSPKHILLVDQMGVLPSFYAVAEFAFVGGSMVPIGGHNIWEPAVFGVPILFGKYMNQDYGLADQGGAIRVLNGEEFQNQLLALLASPEKQEVIKNKMKKFLEGHQGAVEKNLKLVESIFN